MPFRLIVITRSPSICPADRRCGHVQEEMVETSQRGARLGRPWTGALGRAGPAASLANSRKETTNETVPFKPGQSGHCPPVIG